MTGIRQLASHLQLSIGTVSRALNGKADVNAQTRDRVLKAAVELGYVPNQSGRSLRKGTTGTVGLILTQGNSLGENNDNFFFGVIHGLQTVLRKHELDLVLLLCSRDEDPDSFLQRMVAQRIVDAVILTATRTHDERFDILRRANMPFVTLGRSASLGDASWIDLDFEGIACSSVVRLHSRGHQRIAVAVPVVDANLGPLFLEGYRQGLKDCGLPFDENIVFHAETSEEGGYDVAGKVLSTPDRPSAILLIAELMSVGLYRRLGEAGLTPGRDLAVIAERESPVGRFLLPRLTCFRLDLDALGRMLGEMLLSKLPAFAEDYKTAPKSKIWPLELVEGESDPPLQVGRTQLQDG
nr:LacI family DNA-binding transcriptional regulator [uncultured Cohaesibacter sp.]